MSSNTIRPKIMYGTLAFLQYKDKFLLIKRNKEPYKNLNGMIGGKIELGETIKEATLRETMEESGIQGKFNGVKAFLNETILDDNNDPMMHFILAICHVTTETENFNNSEEGNLSWFDINKLKDRKDEIIPSDYNIILETLKFSHIVYIEAKLDSNLELIEFEINK